MTFHRSRIYLVCAALVLLVSTCFQATVSAQKEAIGFNKLLAEVGPTLENGAGINVAQIEANVGDASVGEFLYMPNASIAQFAGKTFVDGSGLSTGTSNHATGTVGTFYYGNTSSIAPGITHITGFEAIHWLGNVLGSPFFGGPNTDPLVENFRVANHSWVARSNFVPVADAVNMLQRLDFYINQNEMTVAVGADNQAALPRLLTQGYNSISVGVSSGVHSFGTTNLYGNGRTKPDIVVPTNNTSRATAIVSSAAALLHQKADNMGSINAAKPEVIKAILMAGATKEEFPTWDRTTSRPIDEQFGAGELNIYNSYFIMQGGEFDGAAGPPASQIDLLGWDYEESLSGNSSLYYEFEIGTLGARDLSVLLTWNMDVIDLDPTSSFNPQTQLADLQLALYDSTNGFLDTQIDLSQSLVDNIEHIYFNFLGPGIYTFEVTNHSAFNTDYGLAWRIHAIPEPSAWLVIAIAISSISMTRRRKK